MKIETPQKRQPCDMSSWHRVAEDDGSTVAYVPDAATAQQVIETERLRAVNAELVETLKQCQARLFVHEGISGLYKLSGQVISRAGGE